MRGSAPSLAGPASGETRVSHRGRDACFHGRKLNWQHACFAVAASAKGGRAALALSPKGRSDVERNRSREKRQRAASRATCLQRNERRSPGDRVGDRWHAAEIVPDQQRQTVGSGRSRLLQVARRNTPAVGAQQCRFRWRRRLLVGRIQANTTDSGAATCVEARPDRASLPRNEGRAEHRGAPPVR